MNKIFKKSRLLALIIAMIIVFTNGSTAFAMGASGQPAKVKFSVERRVIGQLDIIPMKELSIEQGEPTSVVLDRVLKDSGIKYKSTGDIINSFYLSKIKVDGQWLGEFDHGFLSGWMYSVNGSKPGVGMSGYNLHDGDVVRIHYTAKEFGQDVDCVDKIFALREKISQGKNYKEENYTKETFENLKSSIAEAEANMLSNEEIGKGMSTKLGKGDADLKVLSNKMEQHIKSIDNDINNLKNK
ncbi:DUF4430 domain-containing protein [Clostridium frigidicarnis]|uniref:Transcobalamin-like C-terminal domain-containing protein n=1 Tax=Clostridium frigidicarnis TaxID=84698 RepID=A0A1I0XKB4_9CLOT|nr:DUF4430 domain-containing protein [Clostridium frigidicarnis]SFB00383.1 protein of unknown function [Clostridium frigidicarnis]